MLSPTVENEIAALAGRYGEPRRVAVDLQGAPFDPLIMNDRFGEVCMVVRRTNGKLITAIKTFYPPGAFRLLTGGVGHGESIEAALLREVAEETGLDVAVRRFLAVIEYRLETTTDDRQPTTDVGRPRTKNQEPRTAEAENKEQRTENKGAGTENLYRGPSVAARAEPRTAESLATDNGPLTTDQYDFATFAFLLDELGGELAVHDPAERIGAFREVAVAELPSMAETLDQIEQGYDVEIGGVWSDWGRFRAVGHRVVYEALQEV